MLKKIKHATVAAIAKTKKVAAIAIVGTAGAIGLAQPSHAALPDLGVDFGAVVTDIGTGMGGYIQPAILLMGALIAVGIGVAFLKKIKSA